MTTFIAKSNTDGNPYRTVDEHSMHTAEIAKKFIDLMPDRIKECVDPWATLLAAMHDVGKISPGFQKRILGKHIDDYFPTLSSIPIESLKTDHSMIGAASLDAYFGSKFRSSSWAQIIALHHGSIKEKHPCKDIAGGFGGAEWAAYRREFIVSVQKRYGKLVNVKLEPELRNLIAGMVTVSDWIASDEQFFTKQDISVEEQADEAVSQCGFFRPRLKSDLLFEDVFGNPPYEIQSRFIQSVVGPPSWPLCVRKVWAPTIRQPPAPNSSSSARSDPVSAACAAVSTLRLAGPGAGSP